MKIIKAFKQPKKVIYVLVQEYLSSFFPDKLYLRILSFLRFGKPFNLSNPTTFNEKLNWLKLYDRKDVYTTMVDKLSAKKYAADIIGKEYVVPLYAVYNSVDEINVDDLPIECVLKSNQDSGGAIIWKSTGGGMDWDTVISKLKGRNKNYWHRNREWPYKNVQLKFFAEMFLDNGTDSPVLYDYKFWCFNGEPKIMYITCKSKNYFENYYDMDFQPLMIEHDSIRKLPEFKKPEQFELMKNLAKQLSKNIPHVRVDFFLVQGRVYFGEFTFYDWAGLKPFGGDWDRILGEMLVLPN